MNSTLQADKRELLTGLNLPPGEPGPVSRRARWWVGALPLVCAVCIWLLPGAAEEGEPQKHASPLPAPAPASTLPPPAFSLQATGYVVARRAATVSARTTAAVRTVHVEEGSAVAAGEVLARLDDRVKQAQFALAETEREAAASRVEEALAELHLAQQRLERISALVDRQLASRSEHDEAAARVKALDARLATSRRLVVSAERRADVYRMELDDFVIRAPFAGVLTKRSAQPGEVVSPISGGGGFTRTGIATLVDMDSLEVEVDVSEAYISRVRPEQQAGIVLNAYPDKAYDGRVIAIVPAADRNKATIRVRIALLNADARVMPDMAVRVDFSDA